MVLTGKEEAPIDSRIVPAVFILLATSYKENYKCYVLTVKGIIRLLRYHWRKTLFTEKRRLTEGPKDNNRFLVDIS